MEKKRHLSPIRVFVALAILATFAFGAFSQFQSFQSQRGLTSIKPWFASYVDVTATPTYSFEGVDPNQSNSNIILSFIVSSATNVCTPTWGNAYTLDDAQKNLDLERRIARFRQIGGHIAISFGGALNDELATKCTNKDDLEKSYQSVIDRYQIDTIDLDLEGNNLTNQDALSRRSEVIAKLQKAYKGNNKSLAVWLTLPVSPEGLTSDGVNAVKNMLSKGVDLAGINVMTMDYNASLGVNQSMIDESKSALSQTQRQLGIIYNQAGIYLNNTSLWAKIGATPMIGQNDVIDEIFTKDNALNLNEFAISKGIKRLSMWSGNRDIECGENYVNVSMVSDSCSGVKENKYDFANILSKGFEGNITTNAALTTKEDSKIAEEPDDPQKSPYQIWSETGIYLSGTKVVWHHNVYEAKWWTEGDLPDNPVLQAWQTPWQLIGPVLPNESPIPQPTLAPGTYPEWSGTQIYQAGEIILLNGIPYKAKWCTEGDSPAASSSNPDSSPWVPLSQKEVSDLQPKRQ